MTKKNALSLQQIFSRKLTVIATAAVLGLSGCSEPLTEIDDLGNNKESTLVQGRQEAINTLVANGANADSATAVINKLEAQQASASNQNHAGGGSNALLWYMIGRSMSPTAYQGTPASGLTYAGGYRDATTPAKLTTSQSDYLRAPASARPSLEAKLKASAKATGAGKSAATSRGGFSRGGGIGHGG